MCEDETSASIYEAVQVVREANPDWTPSYNMTDFDESEKTALRGLSSASWIEVFFYSFFIYLLV